MSALPAIPLRASELPLPELIDLYMAYYNGRDSTRAQRLGWWRIQLARLTLGTLSDDHVHAELESLAQQPPRYFAGVDATGHAIYKAKKATLAPATVNRYSASLAAVITWSIKKRIAPKGYVHPCRSVERRAEHNEKTRFLSEAERTRLLEACKASEWPLLYLLVLLALTTGARKGELLSLRFSDIDLQRGEAYVQRTKNGEPRVLPLVPAVREEIEQRRGAPSTLVFASSRRPDKAFRFEERFKEALRRARIRGVTFHTLRHSCASMLAQNGATLLEIADLLGHKQLQVTKRYSHLATSHKAALVHRVMEGVR